MVKKTVCIENKCELQASCNWKYEKKYLYCTSHKKSQILKDGHNELMVNLSKKVCKHDRCYKNTCIYDKQNFCAEHTDIIIEKKEKPKKEKKDLNQNKFCANNCGIIASYNFKDLRPLYCSNCVEICGFTKGNNEGEMRNVHNNLCTYISPNDEECISIAIYGFDNIKTRCKTHIIKGMEKLITEKKCIIKDCDVIPSFIYNDNNYCATHKPDEAIANIQKCKECDERSRYNYINIKGAIYCNEHKKENMVDKNKKICIEEKCINYASYNFKNIKGANYCNEHKKENMVSNKVKICKENDCLIEACFGTKTDKKQYCTTHKKDKMSNHNSKKCESCGLFEVKRGNLICSYCNPDANKKTKEKIVYDFLTANNIDFIYNKTTQIECGKYYPDFLIDCNTHFIVIECDEEQHKQYSKECEFSRMNNIYLSNGLPTIFIRFNPDFFYINKIRNKTVITTKLKELLNIINIYMNKSDIEFIELIYMYYNCNCIENCNFIHKKDFKEEIEILNLNIN
jgi:hypothetical protein